jgi:hypothetical protein
VNPHHFAGKELDRLNLRERLALAGHWIALERYDTRTLPLRIIAAVGDSAEECMRQIRERGGKPTDYEYLLASGPF